MKNLFFLFVLFVFLSACVSPTPTQISLQSPKQKQISSAYIKSKPNLRIEVKDAISKGIVIPEMSIEEVFVAGGAFASDFQNISIKVDDGTGTLIPPARYAGLTEKSSFAFIIENHTQYNSYELKEFAVYFENGSIKKITDKFSTRFSLSGAQYEEFMERIEDMKYPGMRNYKK